MSIPVERGYPAETNPFPLEEPPAEQPAAAAPPDKKLHVPEQDQSMLSYWANRLGSVFGPHVDENPRVSDQALTQKNTDRALGRLKAAQEEMIKASGSGNARHLDEAGLSLQAAQNDFKRAVQAEGVGSVRMRYSKNTAAQTAISAAELALSKDRLSQVEAKIPNLPDIPAHEEGRRIPAELYGELARARRDVGVKTDALRSDLNQQALSMRAESTSPDGPRSERWSGRDTRDSALAQLRAMGYGPELGAAGDTPQNGKIPGTIGMTDKERSDVYVPNFQRNASPEARSAFDRGEAVIFAIRHDTPLQANKERGVYDDRYVVLQKTADGTVRVREFDGSQDPNTQYGNGMRDPHFVPQLPQRRVGPYAESENGGAFVDAYSRVADGTIKLTTGPNPGHLYPVNGEYEIEGDINGDGVFNDGYTRKANTNAFQLHAGKGDYSHTGSGGCLTLPPHQWDAFTQATGVLGDGPSNSIYYVQTSESKMQY